MRLLKGFLLVSFLLCFTACQRPLNINDMLCTEADTLPAVGDVRGLPNTVLVLSEGSTPVSLPVTEILEKEYMLAVLEISNTFPGVYVVSRRFAEQLVNTLLSEGHIITNEYITNNFIYLHMEYANYIYLVWWFHNQFMLAGDFVIILESFLR